MTTRIYTSSFDSNSDANFRAWTKEFYDNLIAAGMIDNGDAGSMNFNTVNTVSGGYATAGFRVLKFPDSSIYVKIEFGNNGYGYPGFAITAGTGSDGSGTLTGAVSGRTNCTDVQYANPGNLSTYICVTNDCVNVLFKADAYLGQFGKAYGRFTVAKTTDATGVPDGTGFYLLRRSGAATYMQCVRIAAPAGPGPEHLSFCLVPGRSSTNMDTDSNTLVYPHWGDFPHGVPLLYTCSIRTGQVPDLSTQSFKVLGNTAHTYLVIGAQDTFMDVTQVADTGTGLHFGSAMLWE